MDGQSGGKDRVIRACGAEKSIQGPSNQSLYAHNDFIYVKAALKSSPTHCNTSDKPAQIAKRQSRGHRAHAGNHERIHSQEGLAQSLLLTYFGYRCICPVSHQVRSVVLGAGPG